MDSFSVDPSVFEQTGYEPAYPTPPAMSVDEEDSLVGTPQPEQHNKKKRKAWGQPVPEIKQILPPRKRAKTAEEKEQRKNERILRNRRAADKSRQRQKAAVADLEVRTRYMEEENAALRQIVTQYQAQFGTLPGISLPPPPVPALMRDMSPSPFDDDNVQQSSTPDATNLDESKVTNDLVTTPKLSFSAPTTEVKHTSPSLAPTLFPNQSECQPLNERLPILDNSLNVSGPTQYPAVVLCDLQCQPETYSIKFRWTPSNSSSDNLRYVLSMLQTIMIFQSYSTLMLSPMTKIFNLLEMVLSKTSSQDLSFIQDQFPLIHSLISLPSTTTRPAVFRMKLLSRLLACSPLMARHLLAATDRALQQVVSGDDFATDSDRRWQWSSLMTIKWVILRLEREHRKIRWNIDCPGQQGQANSEPPAKIMAGVDWKAVQRSSKLWRQCNTMNGASAQVAEVH